MNVLTHDAYLLQMTSRTKLKRKEVDDVLGGEDQWKHADSTNGKRAGIPTPYND